MHSNVKFLFFLIFVSNNVFSDMLFYEYKRDDFYRYIESKEFSIADFSFDNRMEVYAVGFCKLYGCHTLSDGDEDYETAHNLILKAIDMGVSDAYYDLGHMYLNGVYVERNVDKALSLFEHGGMDGDIRAQVTLGEIYTGVRGFQKNNEKSFFWYEKAAYLNAQNAMSRISYYYYKGVGVEENYNMAFKWAKKIEDLKSPEIPKFARKLAFFYENGIGTHKNNIQAVKYQILMGSAGRDDVERLRQNMTEEAFQEAVRLANEWQAEHRVRVYRYYQ